MISILKAGPENCQLLAAIGKTSFLESHGNSASSEDIADYVNQKFTIEAFQTELSDPKNIFYILYYDNKPAGYSKIIFNSPHPNIQQQGVTKLERLYLLKEFYNLKLGQTLFKFNVELSKTNHQTGMWLFVWTENKRAVAFYKKTGFKIIGEHSFQISKNHSNPNHQMLLIY